MQFLSTMICACVMACGALPVAAASADSTQMPARELLQPPRVQVASPITDRFALRGVYFRNQVATAIRYDSAAGLPGTLVDAEEMLGLSDRMETGSADIMFRMLDRHRIRADFSQLNRKGDAQIEQAIQFGDDTYFASERVVSAMELRKLGVGYTYSVLRREQIEIGLGLALHLLQIEGSLEAPTRFVRERLDTAGPFATLVADVSWRVSPRFSVNASAHWLDARIDDVKGGYKSWHADVQYRAWQNLAFGIGYTDTRYEVDSTDPEFAGLFDLRYRGPEAFIRVSF